MRNIPVLNTPVILDPKRVTTGGRRIEWPVSHRTRMRFRELLFELVDLEGADQTDREVQDRMAALRDAIRSLPGFPRAFDPERDTIIPVTTTVSR